MKKITLFALTAVISMSAFAQVKTVANAPEKLTNPKLRPVLNPALSSQLSGDRVFSGWLNYALQLDDAVNGFTPGAAAPAFMMIFPDTSIIAGVYTDGTTAYPQFMKAATMLDPKNMPFMGINSTDAFSLDSLGIAYGYLRSLSSAVVDTLIIDIVKHSTALEYTLGGTETYQDIEYTQSSNTTAASNVLATYKVPLFEADSSSTVNEIFIKTTGLSTQAAGSRIGAVVSFKPGYTYSITDSISDKNAFYVFSYEQNGASTAPTYYGSVGVSSSDMNCSYALSSDVRYNMSTTGWNGYFLPTWAWTDPYAYEHHIIEFKISNPPVGISEFENGAKLGQNVPNPTNGTSMIKYELEKNAKVALNVYDVTGKIVATQNIGEQNAGSHTVNFNAADLAAGMYYYSLTVNNAATSAMKMAVIK